MHLLDLLSKACSVALTGYLTNDLAIKMLFRKYGPFGGVILKTKDEFIENTSALVERDIINHHTIENELSKDEFREIFQNIIDDILTKYLYDKTDESMAWIDIPKMSDTINNFINFYDGHKETIISDLIDPVFKNIDVESIMSQKQIKHLSNNLFEETIKTLGEANIIENVINDIYYDTCDKNISNYISPQIFKQTSNNLKDATNDFHLKLQKNFETEIDRTINDLYRELEISSTLTEVEENIKSKTFAELLGKDNTDNIANELLERTIRFLKSKEGNELIYRFLEDLIKLLKNINIPIIDLFNKSIKSKAA